MKAREYIKWYKAKTVEALNAISDEKTCAVMETLLDAWKRGNQVFLIGNGGSAGTATHFAADLVKTVVDKLTDKGIKAVPLSDNIPLVSAIINDWGKEEIFASQLHTFFNEGDVLIAFSVHGGSGSDKDGAWSQNLPKAISLAKEKKGVTIGFAGFDGGIMKDLCDICVVVPVNSTPIVESLHVVLAHAITFWLKENKHES